MALEYDVIVIVKSKKIDVDELEDFLENFDVNYCVIDETVEFNPDDYEWIDWDEFVKSLKDEDEE